jgi:hypothetical protein
MEEKNCMQSYAKAVSLNEASWKTVGEKGLAVVYWERGGGGHLQWLSVEPTSSVARECVEHNVGQGEFKVPSRPENAYCHIIIVVNRGGKTSCRRSHGTRRIILKLIVKLKS